MKKNMTFAVEAPECRSDVRSSVPTEAAWPRDVSAGLLSGSLASVSAIIPTKNRPEDLARTIRTLLAQTILPHEVVVVDQSSDDRSRLLLQAEFRAALDRMGTVPDLKYVHDRSIVGVSAARNRAMNEAAQDIWLFLDDDVVMEPEFIEELVNVYRQNPDIDGVSGVITNYVPAPLALRVWMAIFALGPFREQRMSLYWRANELRDSGVFRVTGFSGGLMSFRRPVASLATFDTRVSEGEDVDFCLSLGNDKNLVIAPRVRLQHLSSPVERKRDQPLWIQRLAATRAFLYYKHWSGALANSLCFSWLCFGMGIAATFSCVRRFSWQPWRALLSGIRAGRNMAQSR